MESYILNNRHFKTINALCVGHSICTPGTIAHYNFVKYYMIHYVQNGKGYFYKDGIKKQVTAGEIFIIKPGHAYKYTPDDNDPWEYIWIRFDGELSYVFEKLNDIEKVDGKIFFEMFEGTKLRDTREEYLVGKIFELISLLFERDRKRKKVNPYILSTKKFIKENYMKKLTVKMLADEAGLNSRYLSRLFKEEEKMPLSEYVIKFKIEKAKDFFEMGMGVSASSKNVGYDDVFTFSKIFKKYTGMSPSYYKNEVNSAKAES